MGHERANKQLQYEEAEQPGWRFAGEGVCADGCGGVARRTEWAAVVPRVLGLRGRAARVGCERSEPAWLAGVMSGGPSGRVPAARTAARRRGSSLREASACGEERSGAHARGSGGVWACTWVAREEGDAAGEHGEHDERVADQCAEHERGRV